MVSSPSPEVTQREPQSRCEAIRSHASFVRREPSNSSALLLPDSGGRASPRGGDARHRSCPGARGGGRLLGELQREREPGSRGRRRGGHPPSQKTDVPGERTSDGGLRYVVSLIQSNRTEILRRFSWGIVKLKLPDSK